MAHNDPLHKHILDEGTLRDEIHTSNMSRIQRISPSSGSPDSADSAMNWRFLQLPLTFSHCCKSQQFPRSRRWQPRNSHCCFPRSKNPYITRQFLVVFGVLPSESPKYSTICIVYIYDYDIYIYDMSMFILKRNIYIYVHIYTVCKGQLYLSTVVLNIHRAAFTWQMQPKHSTNSWRKARVKVKDIEHWGMHCMPSHYKDKLRTYVCIL